MNHIPTVSDGPLLKSYLAALKADMTPTCIDGQTGYFSSRHGNYVVTLDVPNGCVCGSHTWPCKHQYRLAMELNLMPGDFIHDPSKIKYKLDGVDFETAVDRIEQLPATAQKSCSASCPACSMARCTAALFQRIPPALLLAATCFVD